MSDKAPAIVVNDLNKIFKLPHETHSGIKQLLINIFKGRRGYEVQHVLNDISFEVKKGEFFGIVGRNGSGKSTLLKLLAGIYPPDAGSIIINGSLTPFIELGVGFNPELTGRENVFLNGALLGFSRGETESMYEGIVEFAELERFMDQKLKNYSSGMQVRLAFSIAIRANTDILVLDEVLAVGDAAFQQKCYNYFEDLKDKKTTVILVTHDMAAVSRFCDRALFIESGKIAFIGSTRAVAGKYLEENYNQIPEAAGTTATSTKKPRATVEKCVINSTKFEIGDELRATIQYDNPESIPLHFGFQIFGQDGSYVFGTNTKIGGHTTKAEARGKIKIKVKLDLVPGLYFITVATMNQHASEVYDYRTNIKKILIKNTSDVGGVAFLEYKWNTY